jgi:type VI protein secretion system component VasK
MLKPWQFGTLSALAVIALVLVIANVVLFSSNRAAQAEVAGRQQFIQQSVQLETLYQQMVHSLAELSAKNNDAQLKSVLAAQGITFSVAPNDAASVGTRK